MTQATAAGKIQPFSQKALRLNTLAVKRADKQVAAIALGRAAPSEESSGPLVGKGPSVWHGWKGVSHPNSPAGGGGPGVFSSGILGRDDPATDAFPHPAAPATRFILADARYARKTTKKAKIAAEPNPPPKTETNSNLQISVQQDQTTNCEIRGAILSDGIDSNLGQDAGTAFQPTIDYTIPKADFENGHVTNIDGKAEIKVSFTIQTLYAPNAKSTDISAYGRGTTDEDKEKGNVTLGFHESVHRRDYLAILKSIKLPKFPVKVGMKEKDFNSASAHFQRVLNDIDKILKGAKLRTYRSTDEVGFTKSAYEKRRRQKV